MSKSYECVGENNKSDGQSTTIKVSITERKTNILHYYVRRRRPQRAQDDVENYFQCFYRILFKNSAKRAM